VNVRRIVGILTSTDIEPLLLLPGYTCQTTGLEDLFRDVDLFLADRSVDDAVGAYADRAIRGT
jgi:hypothetical protein